MNKTEQEVLKTLKSGVGLTSAEQEILTYYIDKLQKEDEYLREDLFLEKSKLNDVLKCLLDFIAQNIHEVELKTKILNIIRGDNND